VEARDEMVQIEHVALALLFLCGLHFLYPQGGQNVFAEVEVNLLSRLGHVGAKSRSQYTCLLGNSRIVHLIHLFYLSQHS
jgi:hypothetical protein